MEVGSKVNAIWDEVNEDTALYAHRIAKNENIGHQDFINFP